MDLCKPQHKQAAKQEPENLNSDLDVGFNFKQHLPL